MYTLWSSAVLYVVLTTISGSIRKLFQATSFQTTFAKNMTMMSMAGSGYALLGARQLNGKTEFSKGRRNQGVKGAKGAKGDKGIKAPRGSV